MARSVNCVHLIGNLTRDPELRYTQSGKPVCDIGLATNRQWKTDTGEQQEDTEYHKIVVWGKLAEIASQYLRKGMKAYFQGRITSRPYTGQDGSQKYATEIIAEDMMMLSSDPATSRKAAPPQRTAPAQETASKPGKRAQTAAEDVDPDDIPL